MEQIPEWLRKKMMGTLTPEEYGQVLGRKIEAGEMTPEEAEEEWQHYCHRGENTYQGVYGW